MLILKRKVGEEILIDGHIVVKVTEIRTGEVQIGVEAPASVRVVRRELEQEEDYYFFWRAFMGMNIAKNLAEQASRFGKLYRFAWKSSSSKQPYQLRFGGEGQLSYMRDGIMTTTNGYLGTYRRLKEFSGASGDEHEVEIRIECSVFDGDTMLHEVSE